MKTRSCKATSYAVFYFGGKKLRCIRTMHKNRILYFAKENLWQSGYLKFNYGSGYYNDAIFNNLKELKNLIHVFSEMEKYE